MQQYQGKGLLYGGFNREHIQRYYKLDKKIKNFQNVSFLQLCYIVQVAVLSNHLP